MKAAKLLPEKSSAVLNDVDQALAMAVFDRAIGRDGDEESGLLNAAGPIWRQVEPSLYKAAKHELRPIERLAVGELNEFVH